MVLGSGGGREQRGREQRERDRESRVQRQTAERKEVETNKNCARSKTHNLHPRLPTP